MLVWKDELKNSECIGVHPCINTSSIKLFTSALLDSVITAMKHFPVFVTLPGDEE